MKNCRNSGIQEKPEVGFEKLCSLTFLMKIVNMMKILSFSYYCFIVAGWGY